MRLLVAVVMLVAMAPRRVEASCGSPHWLGTPTDTALPVRGSLYVHDEYRPTPGEAPEVTWTGAADAWTATAISPTVSRIDYDATRATAAMVERTTRYTFDPRWQVPEDAPRVVRIWHHEHKWTCSFADSLKLQLDQPTAAIEVTWTFNGVARTFVELADREDGLEVLELGKIDCGRASIRPDELASGGELSLTAIRFDGSRVAVEGTPLDIELGDLATSEDQSVWILDVSPAIRTAFRIGPPRVVSRPFQVAVLALIALVLLILIVIHGRAKPSSSLA